MLETFEFYEAISDYTIKEGDGQSFSITKGDIVSVIKKELVNFTVEKDGKIGKVPKTKLQLYLPEIIELQDNSSLTIQRENEQNDIAKQLQEANMLNSQLNQRMNILEAKVTQQEKVQNVQENDNKQQNQELQLVQKEMDKFKLQIQQLEAEIQKEKKDKEEFSNKEKELIQNKRKTEEQIRIQKDNSQESGHKQSLRKDKEQQQCQCSICRKIVEDLKKQIQGSVQMGLDHYKFIERILLENGNNEIKLFVIECGIVDSLLRLIEKNMENITPENIDILYKLTDQSSENVIQLLLEKNIYTTLFKILDQNNLIIVQLAAYSIFNILFSSYLTTDQSNHSTHPHFDQVSKSGGIIKIYELFCRNLGEDMNNTAAFCISIIYRAREIDQQKQMRQNIIKHLKNILLHDTDEMTKKYAYDSLGYLALNPGLLSVTI